MNILRLILPEHLPLPRVSLRLQDKPGKGTYQWVEPHILKLPGGAVAAIPREDVALAMVELCVITLELLSPHLEAQVQVCFPWGHEHSLRTLNAMSSC